MIALTYLMEGVISYTNSRSVSIFYDRISLNELWIRRKTVVFCGDKKREAHRQIARRNTSFKWRLMIYLIEILCLLLIAVTNLYTSLFVIICVTKCVSFFRPRFSIIIILVVIVSVTLLIENLIIKLSLHYELLVLIRLIVNCFFLVECLSIYSCDCSIGRSMYWKPRKCFSFEYFLLNSENVWDL